MVMVIVQLAVVRQLEENAGGDLTRLMPIAFSSTNNDRISEVDQIR